MNPNTKPTMAMAQALIKSVTYTVLPSGTAIVCEITAYNLHRWHGIANVVDLANNDVALGKKTAYGYALDEVFKTLSWDMHKKMASQEIPNSHATYVAAYESANFGSVDLDSVKDSNE